MLMHSVVAVLILLAGHILQVMIWALVYHYYWGEFVSFASAVYFSLASFTTLGATISPCRPIIAWSAPWRRRPGMLMFGWSTALLVAVVQRTYHHKD